MIQPYGPMTHHSTSYSPSATQLCEQPFGELSQQVPHALHAFATTRGEQTILQHCGVKWVVLGSLGRTCQLVLGTRLPVRHGYLGCHHRCSIREVHTSPSC